MPFLFVGERPSARAHRIGASWRNGKLSAKVLHDALRHAGIDPKAQRYCNVFLCQPAGLQVSRYSIRKIHDLYDAGYDVVALGRKVQAALRKAGVRFIRLVHPAARGRIRLTANYRQHVKDVLGPYELPPDCPF
jgi:uracil-DNA glycosylase